MLQAIKAFALLGGEWVLYILLFLSLWSIAVIYQKFSEFKKRSQGTGDLEAQAPALFGQGGLQAGRKAGGGFSSAEGAVLKAGLDNLVWTPRPWNR